jgi:hypothetical protein
MAQALDDPHRPVVHRCRRLQTPRTEVIIALPSMPPIPVYRGRSTTACVSGDSKTFPCPTVALGALSHSPAAVTPEFSYGLPPPITVTDPVPIGSMT